MNQLPVARPYCARTGFPKKSGPHLSKEKGVALQLHKFKFQAKHLAYHSQLRKFNIGYSLIHEVFHYITPSSKPKHYISINSLVSTDSALTTFGMAQSGTPPFHSMIPIKS